MYADKIEEIFLDTDKVWIVYFNKYFFHHKLINPDLSKFTCILSQISLHSYVSTY
jgi:hypothetical protein